MQVVTQGFREQIPLIGKRSDLNATLNGTLWKPERVKYMFKGNLFRTAMTEVEIDIKGAGNVIDQTFDNVQFGLMVDNAYEYIHWDDLYCYKCEVDEDKRLTKAKTYDRMIEFMVLYRIQSQATNLLDYIKDICAEIGIELYTEDFFNATLPITEDYFVTQKVTYRDVLDQIAETTFCNISIKDGKLLLRSVWDGYDTPETLHNNVVKKGTTNAYWGDVNTFNIGREPQSGDDAYISDLDMVNAPAGRNICPSTINYWESGAYSETNGVKYDSPSRIRLKELLPIPEEPIYFNAFGFWKINGLPNDNIKFIARAFDEDKNFIGNLGAIANGYVYTHSPDVKYLALMIYDSTDASLTFDYWQEMFELGRVNPFITLESEPDKSFEPFRTTGVIELRFVNNQFLDKNRVELAPQMFPQIKGLGYYPMKVETLGLGYIEFGDWFIIPDADTGQLFKTCITNYDFTVTSGTKDIITSTIPNNAVGKYQYASAIEKRMTNTEIIVDKQGNTITSLTEETDELGNRLSQLQQNLSGFEFVVQESGNLNLVLNSVGWKETDFWSVDDGGSVLIIKDTDVANNSSSKSSFLINGTQMLQTIPVRPTGTYCASVVVKNSLLNSGFVRITNGIEVINLCEFNNPEQATGWTKYDVVFTANSNFIYIIMNSQGNSMQVTDLVIAEGELVQSWFPSADEIYTGNTRIDRNGVQVSNSASDRISGMQNGEIYIDDVNGRQVSLNPDLSYMQNLQIFKTFYLGRLRWDIKDAGVDVTMIDD